MSSLASQKFQSNGKNFVIEAINLPRWGSAELAREEENDLLEKKQREKEKKIMAEGGHLPAGWKKEKRGQRWCFQSPDGEGTWNDPR